MADSHVVAMPKNFIVVRILQVIFAVLMIAMCSFLMARTEGFEYNSVIFGVVCGIFTLIISTYILVSERAAQAAYNMWAILSLEILMVIFWLSSMGALAALRAAFTIPIYDKRKRYIFFEATAGYLAVMSTAAGVSAIELILFLVSLIMFSARLHRHRLVQTTTSSSSTHLETINVPHKMDAQPYVPTQQQQQQQGLGYQPNHQPPAMQAYPQQMATAPLHSQPTGNSTSTPVPPAAQGQQQGSAPPQQQTYPSQQQVFPQQQGYPIQQQNFPPQQQQGFPTPTGSPAPNHAQQTHPPYPVYAEAPAEYRG